MAVVEPPPIRRLSVADVDAMLRHAIIAPGDRLELRDGVLVELSPQGDDHAEIVLRLTRLLVRAYPDAFRVGCQVTTTFPSPHELREPDFIVVPADGRGRPRAVDAVLVIEVSDATYRSDRRKLDLYAASGIGVAWIVDVARRRVEVHDRPGAGGYGRMTVAAEADALMPPGCESEIAVAAILPPRDG